MLTVRTELTDRMLIFGERHLCRVLARYAVHYNRQRPHRALQLRPPRPQAALPEPVRGEIRRRPILGGLIDQYEPGSVKPLSHAVGRFWNPTASSGQRVRHRLNTGGNRQLNATLHTIAVCQARDPGPGRDYYLRKLGENKTPNEARRALKRRLANVIYRQLLKDQRRPVSPAT